MKALLTDTRRQYSNYADPTFFDNLDRMEFGSAVAVPEAIDSYMASGTHGDQGLDRSDGRCFRVPVTFYFKPGFVGSIDSGEEYPWVWWLIRGPDGEWRVDGWGA
jgi:hypothetical protein